MHLTFDPDDHDGFTTARDDLLDQFIAWLQDRAGLSADEADEVATDASLALDWKFGYNGGSLVAWATGRPRRVPPRVVSPQTQR